MKCLSVFYYQLALENIDKFNGNVKEFRNIIKSCYETQYSYR